MYQGLEEKIRQKSAALQELRDKLCSGKGNSSCDFLSQTDESIQACAALTQRVSDTKEMQKLDRCLVDVKVV